MVWAVFALMTGAVVLAVLWPLGGARAVGAHAPDVSFYRSQIEEIDRDLALGLLTPADAEAARSEAARRLLRASDAPSAPMSVSRTGIRLGALAALLLIPAITLSLYGFLGNPELPDQPLKGRQPERQGQFEVETAVSKIEAHLAANPNDGRGWDILAPVYMRLGRYEDAARAFGNAARVLGETPERLTAQGEALVYGAREQVSPQARANFEKVLQLNTGDPVASFYIALSREQSGDRAGALADFMALAGGTPIDAPWQPAVRARILALGGTPPEAQAGPKGEVADAVRAMPTGEQRATIRSMVDSLAARLEQNGNDVEGWLRLLRSYVVLQEPDLARAALMRAQKALAEDADALRRLEALAAELGLKG